MPSAPQVLNPQRLSTVGKQFEDEFAAKDLASDIDNCGDYELTPLFLELLSLNQPVLEAGCGSGKWMHFFKRRGIVGVGIDWSDALQARSRDFDPTVAFDTGDLRALPYADGQFGSVISLGAVEHVVEGPRRALQEFVRVLRPGGVGVITVPYLSPIRKLAYPARNETIRKLKGMPALRRLTGRPERHRLSSAEQRATKNSRFRPDIRMQLDVDGHFFQYLFDQKQWAEELTAAGFMVRRLFGFERDQGILFTYGRMAGKWDLDRKKARFSVFGRFLASRLAADQCGHMLCAVVEKPHSPVVPPNRSSHDSNPSPPK